MGLRSLEGREKPSPVSTELNGIRLTTFGVPLDDPGELVGLLRGIRQAVDEQVFDGDLAARLAVVVLHRLHHLSDRPLVVDGHEGGRRASSSGEWKGEGEVDPAGALLGKLIDLGHQAEQVLTGVRWR